MRTNSDIATWRVIRGFTVIEVMVAVAILAILLGLATPSFVDTIRSNQIVSQTNALITAMALARSEAVKRGTTVSVCSRNNASCAASTDWSSGWLVFVDSNGNGATDVGEETLQVSSAPPQGMVIDSSEDHVTLQGNGENLTTTTFDITKSGCGAGQRRQITLQASGRTSLQKQDCS